MLAVVLLQSCIENLSSSDASIQADDYVTAEIKKEEPESDPNFIEETNSALVPVEDTYDQSEADHSPTFG